MKWYKHDPDAFLCGTAELTLEEVGAYSLVLDLIYSRDGNVPDDEKFICRNLRCDPRTWRRLRARLIEVGKIQSSGGLLVNLRAKSEISSAQDRIKVMSELRQKQLQKQRETHGDSARTTTTTTTTRVSKKDNTFAPRPEFEEFWKGYPKRKGPNPKSPARVSFEAAVKKGAAVEVILRGAKAFAVAEASTDPQFIPMAVTWLKQRRWEDYASGEVVPFKAVSYATAWELRAAKQLAEREAMERERG